MMGILTISCQEEIADVPPSVTEGNAFVSLNVDMGLLPSAKTRADEIGSADELRVNSVRLVLYGEDTPGSNVWRVKYAFEFDIKTPGTWSTPTNTNGWLQGGEKDLGNTTDGVITPSGKHLYAQGGGNELKFTTFAQRIVKRHYKMLVILNGKDVVLGSGDQSIYDVTKKDATLVQFNAAVTAELQANGMIAGSNGFVMTNHQGLVDVPETALHTNADAAHAKPVAVSVDRMVAKVTVKNSSTFKFPTGVDPNSATWGLAVTNKRTYWMRQQIGTENPQASMANLYAEDPNYGSVVSGPNIAANFDKRFFETAIDISIPSSKVQNTLGQYEYVLENTTSAVTKEKNEEFITQTTHIVLGYKYTPSGFSAGESFYVFNNTVLSQTEINGYIGGAPIPSGLAGLGTALTNITTKGLYKLDGTNPDYYESQGLRFCKGGQIYYYFPIRHFNQPQGSLGYYGVVRNNIYDITINSFSPPEIAGPYLSAEINIQPWSQRGQNNVIGFFVDHKKYVPVKIYHYSIMDNQNLYQLWSAGKVGSPGYAYEEIMAYIGQTVEGTTYNKVNLFNTMSGYQNLLYTYSSPFSIKVTGNANDDILRLYYSNLYVSVGLMAQQEVCFIKSDGTILTVQGDSNPRIRDINFVTPVGSPDYGCMYMSTLVDTYSLVIRDGAQEYKISPASGIALYYDMPTTPTVDGKVSFAGYGGQTAMEEPVYTRSGTGPVWITVGSRGVAIICVPK